MTPSRATTVDELLERMAPFRSAGSIELARAFRPRPTDVFIATYPKCGTTWLQQIVHGLRTRGSMDFDEITEVVPWLEMAHDLGLDVDGDQAGEPRAFKSHASWDELPKGARYICAFRDPKDVLVSMYRFFEGWIFEPGTISLDTFAREFFLRREGSRRYWTHVSSWWAVRDRPEVLGLAFEDMKEDLRSAIEKVAQFIGCELDEGLREVVEAQSGIEFMSAHKHQFDDHLIREARDAACGLPPGGDSSKVRTGRVGDHSTELSRAVIDALDAVWTAEIGGRLGLESYAALREALRRT